MKAFVFLAIFVLLSQVHGLPDFTDFFKKFVSRLPMDVETKAEIQNNGLACLDLTNQVISHSIQALNLAQNNNNDAISPFQELLQAVEVIEGSLLPKCLQTYQQIISYFEENANLSQINSPAKVEIFRAKLIQIATRVFIELSQNQTLDAAQDLTLFLESAFGLIRVYLPPTIEFNSTKYVSFNQGKFIPLFLKGFFSALGVENQTKINGTIQCIVDLTSSLVGQEDFLNQVNTLLNAFERCNQMEMISLESVHNIIETIMNHPGESFLKMIGSAIMKLPEITQSEINMKVYLRQGEYELVGKHFAINLLRVYQGLLL